MRIATSTLFDRGLSAINVAQVALSKTQQQVSTGYRVNNASDDPIAASEILRVDSALANNTQYLSNQNAAQQLLGQTDATLGQVGDLLQSVRTTLVAANNGALSDTERAALGTELGSRLDQLVSLANTKDGNGHFLFAGYRDDATPFARTSSGVTYGGDDGSRQLQVSPTRQMATTENGADLFTRIPAGNGVFTTKPASTNTGTGIVDPGQVVAPGALTGHGYSVQFTVAGGATTYQVVDTTTGAPVAAPATSGNPFASGTAITVDGQQFSITGAPANGDAFTVAPAGRQSIFQTLQDAAALLSAPSGGGAGLAKIHSGITAALGNVDNALDHTLSVRATVGVRQNELDALTTSATDADTQGQKRLSDLRDTDYASAVADLAKQQAALSAAQKTFATIGNRTLFDYL